MRLLRAHGDGRGCVLVVEDLHWADPETLAALDYLGDALPTEPVLCVATARPEGDAAELLERLERRDPAAIIRVAPLAEDDVDHMVAACLATPTPPPGLTDFVRAHGDGTPFLVEELLAGLVAAGTLRHEDGLWVASGELTPTVPASLRESIRRRMGLLDPTARRVVGAAALLGRRFDWELLPGIADVDGRAVVDALRAAVDAQIVAVDGDGFVFRHSLTREAVAATCCRPSGGGWRGGRGPRSNGPTPASRAPPASWPRSWRRRQVRRRPPPNGWSRAPAARSPPARSPPPRARRAAPAASPRPTSRWPATPTRCSFACSWPRASPSRRGELGSALLAPAGARRRADLLVGLARAALTAGDVAAAERGRRGRAGPARAGAGRASMRSPPRWRWTRCALTTPCGSVGPRWPRRNGPTSPTCSARRWR